MQRGGKEELAEFSQDSAAQPDVHPALGKEPDALRGSALELSLL